LEAYIAGSAKRKLSLAGIQTDIIDVPALNNENGGDAYDHLQHKRSWLERIFG
jgi:hypothetical protein